MAGLIRMIMGLIVSAFLARIIDGLMNPKTPKVQDDRKDPAQAPMLDLKPCPVCGVYTAQPATHCAQK